MEIGFLLKKFVSGFLMPLPIGVIFGLIGLFFLYRNSYKKAKLFLTASLIWIALISYNPFANALLHPLENSYQKVDAIDKNIEYALLLGGDFEGRAYEILELFNKNKNLTIITSGYEGKLDIPEAIKNRDRLIKVGIPKEKIIMQTKPKDTKEEALYIKKLLGGKPFYLITSAYHMPRALALFKKEGLNALPAPTNFLIKGTFYDSFVSGSNTRNSQIAWHEYLGLIWSKLRGQI